MNFSGLNVALLFKERTYILASTCSVVVIKAVSHNRSAVGPWAGATILMFSYDFVICSR